MAVMLYVRFPLSLRNVEDLLHERGIDVSHEAIRFWWHRFGPMFASEIRKRRIARMKSSHWRWHLDEMFVKINGERHYLWRAVDHEGEVLESFVTKTRDKKAALKFLRKAMRKHGRPDVIVTDRLRSYGAALKEIGNADRQETGRWLNNRAENSHLPFRRREPKTHGAILDVTTFSASKSGKISSRMVCERLMIHSCTLSAVSNFGELPLVTRQ